MNSYPVERLFHWPVSGWEESFAGTYFFFFHLWIFSCFSLIFFVLTNSWKVCSLTYEWDVRGELGVVRICLPCWCGHVRLKLSFAEALRWWVPAVWRVIGGHWSILSFYFKGVSIRSSFSKRAKGLYVIHSMEISGPLGDLPCFTDYENNLGLCLSAILEQFWLDGFRKCTSRRKRGTS